MKNVFVRLVYSSIVSVFLVSPLVLNAETSPVATTSTSGPTPVAASTPVATSTSSSFLHDLTIGDTAHPDIENLQRILNSNVVTRVAESGPGSNTALTSFFGTKTRDAVMRFQEMYASDILIPGHLTKGTGVVGSFTRKKLNQLLIQQLSVAPTTSDSLLKYVSYASLNDATKSVKTATGGTIDGSQTAPANSSYMAASSSVRSYQGSVSANHFKIIGLSTYRAVPGQAVSIFGEGFADESNAVYVGSDRAGFYNAEHNSIITFIVPKVAESAAYQLAVTNFYGTTNSGSIILSVDVAPLIATSTATSTVSTSTPATTTPPHITTTVRRTVYTTTQTTAVSITPNNIQYIIPQSSPQFFFNLVDGATTTANNAAPSTFFLTEIK